MSPIFDSEIKKGGGKEELEEKKELLKREEIRTMEKDLSRLREAEAQKERERIAALKPEEKIKKPEEEKKEKEKEKERKELLSTLIPKPPKRPPTYTKAAVRAGIAAFLVFLLGFFAWLFLVKEEREKTTEEEQLPSEEEQIVEKVTIPASLIAEVSTTTLEVSGLEEVSLVLSQFLEQKPAEQGFIRILLKNTTENKILGLKEFFEAFSINSPPTFFEKLNNDFTLFLYSGQHDRLGFITRIEEKEGLDELIANWEGTLEGDTENLFSVLGKTGPALAPNFRTSSFGEGSFRFLTISTDDFGVCYALMDEYFLFTTSFESMEKLIQEVKLKSLTLKEKIGQLFVIGFEGTNLTPQLEEIFKKYRPGGVLLLSRNIESEEQLRKLIKDLQDLSLNETGLPLFIAVDQEGGIISRVDFAKEKTPQAEIKNTDQAFLIGQKRETELKELGINLNLAPVLDITQESDFLFGRSFQKKTDTTGLLAKFLILGQKAAGALSVIKHFPGYEGIAFDPEEELAKTDLLPEISQFKKAMEANPDFVMTANVVYKNLDPQLPFTFSPDAIQFLKDNLGENVLIISDDLAQNYLLENFSLKEVVVKPVEAGIDLLIFSGWEVETRQGLEAFYTAFENGEIQTTKVESVINKIIKLKKNLVI
jgi:beta-N-acetylhexosaminidase